MIRRCIIIVLASALHLSVIPSVSRAEGSQDVRIAQKLFEEGAAAYQAKKYPEAMVSFRKAYTYVPAAAFLYNAARVAEKMGDFEQALGLAKQAGAQKVQPLPEQMARSNEKLIQSLESKISEEKMRAEAQRTMQWSWVGYSGVGAGVLGLGFIGGAAYLGAQASSDFEDLRTVHDKQVFSQTRSDIESSQTMGQAFLYSGIALVALGGGMVAWDLMTPGESPFSVTAGPNSAGLSFSGEF